MNQSRSERMKMGRNLDVYLRTGKGRKPEEVILVPPNSGLRIDCQLPTGGAVATLDRFGISIYISLVGRSDSEIEAIHAGRTHKQCESGKRLLIYFGDALLYDLMNGVMIESPQDVIAYYKAWTINPGNFQIRITAIDGVKGTILQFLPITLLPRYSPRFIQALLDKALAEIPPASAVPA